MIAWLCLFSFGLDMAIHLIDQASCKSSSGEQVEWICVDNEPSACSLALVEQSHSDESDAYHAAQEVSHQCEDCHDDADHDQAHHLLAQPRHNAQADFVLPPVLLTTLPSFSFEPRVVCDRPTVDFRIQSPDSVARLRTIILNV
tara:strand:- start:8893 stop:9324 length:432 start_codon:yes stop_codon:yes gene_type:complete